MLQNYPQIKLLVIGSTFFGDAISDNDFTRSLKEKTNNLKDRIFFTGFVPYREISSYLRIADISVLPSMWEEPFGLTILESMAAGIPLITTNSGGIPEVCGDTALIIERDDVSSKIADAILFLYNNPQKRQMMTQAALCRSKLFSKEKYAERFFSALISNL